MFFVDHDPKFELGYLAWHVDAIRDGRCIRDWGLQPGQIETPAGASEVDVTTARGRESLRALIDGDPTRKPLLADLTSLQAALDSKAGAFSRFFALFEWPMPAPPIRIHLTRYGPGGSYMIGRGSERHPDVDIVVRFDRIDDDAWMIANSLHETVHLIIENPLIRKNRIPHAEKEGIVSHIQQSKEARAVHGPLPWPTGGYALQPSQWSQDWIEEIPWNTRPDWR